MEGKAISQLEAESLSVMLCRGRSTCCVTNLIEGGDGGGGGWRGGGERSDSHYTLCDNADVGESGRD